MIGEPISPRAVARAYRLAKGSGKVELAERLVNSILRYASREPFWEQMKSLGISKNDVKDALQLLEDVGRLKIRRSRDGRRLYVLTLRDIHKNPVSLDRWLMSHKDKP